METPMQSFYSEIAYSALHVSYFGVDECGFLFDNLDTPHGYCFAFSTPAIAKHVASLFNKTVIISYELTKDITLINRDRYMEMCAETYDPEREIKKEIKRLQIEDTPENRNNIFDELVYQKLFYSTDFYNSLVVAKNLSSANIMGFFILDQMGNMSSVTRQFVENYFPHKNSNKASANGEHGKSASETSQEK